MAFALKMETHRETCSACGRQALVETIARNEGICEWCAKAKAKTAIEDGESLSPRSERVVLIGTFLLTVAGSGAVVWRCLESDWGWFWSLFSIIWSAPIAFNVISFLIVCVLSGHRKMTEPTKPMANKTS